MKKKNLLIAAMLSMVAVGGITTYEIIKHNTAEEIVCNTEAEKLNLEETDKADDSLFGGNSEKFEAGKISLNSAVTDDSLVRPEIGRQYFYDTTHETLSIRFFAAVKSKNVKAVWTRALYDAEGNVSSAFGKGTYTSTTAYTALQYDDPEDGNKSKTLYATDVEVEGTDEKPFNYFVIYTIKYIPKAYASYYFDARVEISNDTDSVASKTCSVATNSTANASAIKVEELSINNTVKQNKTNSAGNTIYTNETPKTLYKTGEDIDTSNIIAKVGSSVISSSAAKGFDNTKTGRQTIELDFGRASTTFDVYVVDTPAYYNETAKAYEVTVDKTYSGEIGAVVENKGNMFTTISQALEYLQDTTIVPNASNKILNIASGTYNEKLEITTPNLTINGAGTANTKIEWDSLYGIVDLNGFINTTDSTMTVAVRDTATNCKINNVIISNKYNNIDAFNDTKAPSYTEDNKTVVYAGNGERALALLVQADQFVMEDSKLLGWQDTLELFTGRQYFKNTYISGCIDYIFGTNSTTLFDSCTIHTVKGKTNASAGNVNAYITASKGLNKNSSDAVDYGFIFDHCNFTSDSDFVGTYAFARPWTVYSSVAILNSTFDSKLATAESKTISNGLLSGATQDVASLKIKFYNNKYASTDNLISLTNDLTNVDTSLTSETAANYTNYSVIYGKSNGGVSYALAWDPVNGLETDNNTYVSFNGVDLPNETGLVYTSNLQNLDTTITAGTYTIAVHATKLSSRGSDTQMNSGTTLTFTVPAGSSVTMVANPGYHNYTISGIAATKDTYSVYYTAETNVVIAATDTAYLYTLVINPNALESECDATYVPVVDTKTYVSFNGADLPNGTGLVYTGSISNEKTSITAGTYTINVDATAHGNDTKLARRDSDTQMNLDTTMTFTVPAGSSVTMVSYPGQYNYTISGIAATANTFSVYYSEETSVVIKATTTAYLYTLIINPSAVESNCDATYVKPAANKLATPTGLTLSGSTLSWNAVEHAISYEIYLDGKTAPSYVINGTTYTFTIGEYFTDGLHTVSVDAIASGYEDSDKTDGIYILCTEETKLKAGDTITFGTTGNFEAYKQAGLITVSNGFQNSLHSTTDSQVKGGTMTFTLAANTKLVIHGNYSVNYSVTLGSNDPVIANCQISSPATHQYEFTVDADTVVVIDCQCNSGNISNYWYDLTIVSV